MTRLPYYLYHYRHEQAGAVARPSALGAGVTIGVACVYAGIALAVLVIGN